MTQWTDWTIKCVIVGADLYQALSQGQISKEKALEKIRNLSSEFSVEEVNGLLSKINSMVYSGRSSHD